jgi:hypothetical protein
MVEKAKAVVQAILEERRACSEFVQNWADEIEREKTLVSPNHVRLLAKAIMERGSNKSYTQNKRPVSVHRDHSCRR